MVAAIVNRAQRRLAGAGATEVDHQQSKAALYQIERIQKQLLRIDEAIHPANKPHVEPTATHHDSATECAARAQTRDRTGGGALPPGRTQSPRRGLAHRVGVAASR